MTTLQLPDSDPSDAGVLQGDPQPGLGGELQCSADEVSAQCQQWASFVWQRDMNSDIAHINKLGEREH